MTVQTTTTAPSPAAAVATYTHGGDVAVAPSPHSDAVEYLRSWSEGLQIIGTQMAPLIWTDIVPLHHWPMPKGTTLQSFANPRIKHPNETDEEYARRQQGAAASATAVAMRGATLGIDPFVALAEMWNIRGKLGMSTKLRNAVARGRGIRTWDQELSPESVTCCGIDPLSGETVSITITMADAQRAGWTKQNENYTKNPVDMLWSRAMARVLDRVAGHVLDGVASVDDLRDDPGQVVESTAAPVRVTTVEQLQAAAAAAPATAPPAPVDEQPPVAMIDQSTWKSINTQWTRLGVKGPGAGERRLDAARRMVGRQIAVGSELTAAEADVVLDTLQSISADDADRIADVLGETVPEPDQHDDVPPADDVPPTPDAHTPVEPKGWEQ